MSTTGSTTTSIREQSLYAPFQCFIEVISFNPNTMLGGRYYYYSFCWWGDWNLRRPPKLLSVIGNRCQSHEGGPQPLDFRPRPVTACLGSHEPLLCVSCILLTVLSILCVSPHLLIDTKLMRQVQIWCPCYRWDTEADLISVTSPQLPCLSEVQWNPESAP